MAQQKRKYYYDRYRILTRPDDEIDVFDAMPAFPRMRDGDARHTKDYHKEIAWTTDYRGDNDDVPSLMFIGAGFSLIKKVFIRMFSQPTGLFIGASIYRYGFPHQKKGKAWERVIIELRGYRPEMMSLMDFGTIMQNIIYREYSCNIRYLKLNKFLNS